MMVIHRHDHGKTAHGVVRRLLEIHASIRKHGIEGKHCTVSIEASHAIKERHCPIHVRMLDHVDQTAVHFILAPI